MVKLLVALLPTNLVLLQITQNDKALAHIELDPENARTVADQMKRFADLAEVKPK